METNERFLLEQLVAWLSQTSKAVFTMETDPRLGYAACQMAWLAAPTDQFRMHGLMGMAYFEKQLNKQEQVHKLVKMTLQTLAGTVTPKSEHFQYTCWLLTSERPVRGQQFTHATELLIKVAQHNHKKWKNKKTQLPAKRFQPGAQLANQFNFFERPEPNWINNWLIHQNEIAASYIYSLPEIIDAGDACAKNKSKSGFDSFYIVGDELFIKHRNSLVASSHNGKKTRKLIEEINFKDNEKLGQLCLSPNRKWIAYQKQKGRRTASICFISTENPQNPVSPLDAVFACSPDWADERGFYYVDYKLVSGDYEFPQVLMVDPFDAKRTIYGIYASRKLGTAVSELMVYPDYGYAFFKVSEQYPRERMSLVLVSFETYTSRVVFTADWFWIGTISRWGVLIITHNRESSIEEMWQVRWPGVDLDEPLPIKQIPITNKNGYLCEVTICGERMVAHFRSSFHSELRIFTENGEEVAAPKLPYEGIISNLTTGFGENEIIFAMSSAAVAKDIFILNVESLQIRRFFHSQPEKPKFATEMEIQHATANDGTQIPILLLSKTKIEKNGHNPTICYGYGGHNLPAYDGYNLYSRAWLEMGGVFAVAAVRGGGDKGPGWHRNAVKKNKHISRDDFISVCKFLIDENYTSKEKLGAYGASAGGLLVGSVMAKAPELLQAAVVLNGIHDMPKMKGYENDYGRYDRGNSVAARLKYSPLHSLQPNTEYPATLIIAATKDQIVPPWHSYKFFCALQQCQSGDKPILLRTFATDHDLRSAYSYPTEILGFFAHHLGLRNKHS